MIFYVYFLSAFRCRTPGLSLRTKIAAQALLEVGNESLRPDKKGVVGGCWGKPLVVSVNPNNVSPPQLQSANNSFAPAVKRSTLVLHSRAHPIRDLVLLVVPSQQSLAAVQTQQKQGPRTRGKVCTENELLPESLFQLVLRSEGDRWRVGTDCTPGVPRRLVLGVAPSPQVLGRQRGRRAQFCRAFQDLQADPPSLAVSPPTLPCLHPSRPNPSPTSRRPSPFPPSPARVQDLRLNT